MYIKRHLEEVVIQMSQVFPVILVTGPRQVGKTTMLRNIAANDRTYVTLDNPLLRDLAKSDPELFLQRYHQPVLIDEIQYAPELLPYIKMEVDTNKQPGDFWLTGSQMFHTMKNVSESLAGRVGVISMLGLSTSEIFNFENKQYSTAFKQLKGRSQTVKNVNETFERIYKGSMPALYESAQDIEQYFSSYVNTYLQRDIKDLTQVVDELSFMRFMQACAARTSQMVNYSDLARDVGISSPTAKQWLSILVSSGVIALVEPYFNNALKRIVKAPNMFFLDTGLCAYLTLWTNPYALELSAMSGAFFESYVVGEIIKSFYNAGKRPPIYYYRDSEKKEIDIIIEQDQTLYPIEIKKSGSPKRNAARHFSVLDATGLAIGEGNVICLCKDLIPIDRKNHLVPVGMI